MENYDLVVHKTVKDLFKSNTLNQILKYRQNKEKEVAQKEEDLKKLILEKYPFLIKSLSNLEEIYSNIPNLEKLREGFQSHIEDLKNIEENNNLFEIDCNDKNIFDECGDFLNIEKGEKEVNYEAEDYKSDFILHEHKIISNIEGISLI